jgi:hypothetical protein
MTLLSEAAARTAANVFNPARRQRAGGSWRHLSSAIAPTPGRGAVAGSAFRRAPHADAPPNRFSVFRAHDYNVFSRPHPVNIWNA